MIRFTRGDIAVATVCLTLAACGGGGDGGSSTPPTELPASVSIQSTAKVETGATADFATSLTSTDGISFAWTYGDGTTGTGATTSHVYPRAGTYPVTVSVSNTAGDKRTASFDVSVAAYANVAGLACTGASGTGWCWQNSGIAPHRVEKAIFLPASPKGWAVGRYGTILATTDGGLTWTPENPGVTGDLVDVRFRDENHGVALGSTGFLVKTADAGKTWTRIALAGMTSATPTIAAFDPAQIVITGDSVTLASHDDGASWSTTALPRMIVAGADCWSIDESAVKKQAGCEGTPVTLLPPAIPDGKLTFYGGSFSSEARGMILGNSYHAPTGLTEQYAWSTSDAGAHWARTASPVRGAGATVQMTDYVHAYAYTSADDAWVSADAGRTWQPVAPPADMANLGATWTPVMGVLPATSKLWMATRKRLAMTQDGGTWQEIDAPDAASANLFSAFPKVVRWSDENHIVASRDGALYVTQDGGANWQRVLGADPRDHDDQASATWFRDPKHGLLALGNGSLRATSDGGQTWTRRATPVVASAPVALRFTSDQEGWLMQGGVLSHSIDAGATWSKASLPAEMQGTALRMNWGDALHGWVVVGSDLVQSLWSTTDGGKTWHVESPATFRDFGSLAFEGASSGVGVDGTTGNVWRTTDGGATWNFSNLASVGASVRHTGAHSFWLEGADDTHVLRSTDGGATWKTLATPARAPGFVIAGSDDAHVWLAAQGAILVSTDNGDTWTPTAVPADVHMTSLFAIDNATLWGATGEGPVLATATGGH